MSKWLSGNIRHACCPACGGFSEVHSTTARQCSAAALAVGGLSVLGFAVWRLHPAWLVGGLIAAALTYLLAWHRCALHPLPSGGWKIGTNWLFSLFAVVLLGVWWFGRYG
jgi:hypothetical protein